jgi:cytosine permease
MSKQQQVILEEEYENSPVPSSARKSLLSVSLVWVGFPMIMTGTVTGATVVAGLGFSRGMLAILIGNLILFAYVGMLGVLSTKKGYNFSLQSSITFGKKGSIIVSGLLSTLVIGWFAVQTGLTGSSMNTAFGSNALVITLFAGILYILVTLIGVRALTYIGALSAPFFLIIGFWAVQDAITHSSWSSINQFSGNHSLTFGAAVTMVVALFADSGTMTADFNRWSKNKKESLLASFTAFPLASMIAMVFGGLIAACALTNQNPDFFQYIASKGGAVSILSIILLFLNLGSVCAHCLYNASVGWSNLLNQKMRKTAVVIGIIGTLIALSGAWNHFIEWLTLLGIVVPPIGAIIIVDQMIQRKDAEIENKLRISPFISWAIGALCGLYVEFLAPDLSTAAFSLLSAGVFYWILSSFERRLSPFNKNDVQKVA